MHIAIFGDQHIDSAGGAQVSTRLQRQFLEAAGHTVSVVAPRRIGHEPTHPGNIDTPAVPITFDREYSLSWPGKHVDRFVDRAFHGRPPVDIVHVQADFWGAFTGYRFAARHRLPVVHTMHNRVDVGLRALTPLAPVALAALNLWRRLLMPKTAKPVRGWDGWAYLRGLAADARAVTAPSGHFARRLEAHDVAPHVDVVWNGIDDSILAAAQSVERASREGAARFVWIGRMSPEKRLLPFLEALAVADVDAEVEIIGGGGQLRAAKRLIATHRPRARIHFAGRLSYPATLARIARADAVVQTSIGFETQGMTPFEAASLGVPSVISDPDIAAELESGFWQVPDASIPALADTLRVAAQDIVGGRAEAANPEIASRFRQSSRTAAMLDVYERVLAQG